METRMYVAALFRANLPASNIVDSDFTFLNDRLADHYGVRASTARDAARWSCRPTACAAAS